MTWDDGFYKRFMISIIRIGVMLLLFWGSRVSAGDSSGWNVLKEVHQVDNHLRLILIPYENGSFGGCSPNLTIDIEEYDNFKWNFVAPIIGSEKPEGKEPINTLRTKLNKLIGKPLLIVERTPLNETSNCHFSSDAAVLNNNFLFLYFKLYRK